MDSASADRIFCFGQFEAHVIAGKLFRQGREIKLQDQPFRLLIALLERAGRMVPRQELKEILWPGGAVEFDKSLDVAMAKLRQALGDDANNPLFIETTPKRGYHFIAPLRVLEEPQGAAAEPAPGLDSTGPGELKTEAPVKSNRIRHLTAIGGVGVLFVATVGAFWYRQSDHSPKLAERASVLIGDFANETGDASFDRVLRAAAGIDFAQSPYLTVVSDERIGDGLQALGRPPDDVLEPAISRQVCQQQHAAVAINGKIERQTSGYLLSMEASRCADGSMLANVGAPAAAKAQVLATLATAIVELRKEFGESKESLKQYDVTVVQGTTNSLEALKAYQLGMELRTHTRNIDAIPAFKTAIALDPNFAIAYAQLGSCYSNMQQIELAAQYLSKAFELREHATEPERLYIAGRYFDIVTGEMEKGASIYKLWSEIYPNDWRGFSGVANDANVLGRYDVGAEAAAKAIVLEPQHAYGYTNRALALLGLNRLEDAAKVANEAVRRGLDGSVVHSVLYSIALIQGDESALARERAWEASRPEEMAILNSDAELAEARGKISESIGLFSQLTERTRNYGLLEYAETALAQEALFDVEMGLRKNALEHIQASAKLGANEFTLELSALVYARLGDAAMALSLQEQIDRRFPLSTFNISVFAPAVRTALAMHAARSATDILDAMSKSRSYETGQQAVLIPTYVRAIALLQAHSAVDAEMEFKRIIDNPGVDSASPFHSLAYLGLGRALLMQNRSKEAREAYQALMQRWQAADANLPMVQQAKHEYAALLTRQT
jgi:eukaryotic-like serine/threonine-protein kinase